MRGDLEGANADEIMRDTLRLIDTEIAAEQEYIEDLNGQLAYGQRQLRLALASRTAILALLSGFDADDVAEALVAPAPQPAALPEPSTDPLDWSLVRAPWGLPQWAKVYALLRPEIEAALEPEPVAAMRAAIVRRPPAAAPTPPKALPACVASAAPRNTRPDTDGRPLAEGQCERALAALSRLAGADGLTQISLGALSLESDVPKGSMVFIIRRLADAGRVEIVQSERVEGVKPPNSYRVIGETAADASEPTVVPEAEPVIAPLRATAPQTSADALLHVLNGIVSPQGVATGTALELCLAVGMPFSVWDIAKGALIKRGDIKVFAAPARPNGAWSFKVTAAVPAKEPPAAKQPAPPAAPAITAEKREIAPAPAPPPRPPSNPTATAPAPKPITAEAFIPDELDRPYTGPCSLMNLRRNSCHWPVGDARPQLYCGKDAGSGEEYCATHQAAMFSGAKAKARVLGDRASHQHLQANREKRAM
jgi:hypothetical protein